MGSGSRSLDITLLSAEDLKKVKRFSKMNVYAIVTVYGESQTTSVDRDSGTKPIWNHKMRFTIDEAAALRNNFYVSFSIKANGSCFGDSDLGEVYVPIKEMLSQSYDVEERHVSYSITTPGGRSKGILNIAYKFSPPPPPPAMAPALPQNPAAGSPPPVGPVGYTPSQDHQEGSKAAEYQPPKGGYPPPQQYYAGANSGYPQPQGGYPPLELAGSWPAAYPPPLGGYPKPEDHARPAYYPSPLPPPQPDYGNGARPYPPPYPPPFAAAPAVVATPASGPGFSGYQPPYSFRPPVAPQQRLGAAAGVGALGLGIGAGLLGGLAVGELMDYDSD